MRSIQGSGHEGRTGVPEHISDKRLAGEGELKWIMGIGCEVDTLDVRVSIVTRARSNAKTRSGKRGLINLWEVRSENY